jgi:hypothetical protein
MSNNGTEAQALINDEPNPTQQPQPQSYQPKTTTSVASLQLAINTRTPAYAEQTEVTLINQGNNTKHQNTTTHKHSDGGIAVPVLTGEEPNRAESTRHGPENADKTTTPRHDMDTDETDNNELETTIELPLNNWQREWAQRFNNITDNKDL